MQPGSENAMVTGQGLIRAFRGPKLLSTLAGSRIFFNTDQSFAGLGTAAVPGAIVSSELNDGGNSYAAGDTGTIDTGDGIAAYEVLTVDGSGAVVTYSLSSPGSGYEVREHVTTTADGAQPGVGLGFSINILSVSGSGRGSVFKVQDLLVYIGQGQVAFEGAYLAGIFASATLSLLKKSGGVYAAGALTGPFQAGHAQPPAPTIFQKSPPSAGKVSMSAAIAVVIWRISSITGQVSLMSEPSNVLTLVNGSAIVPMPALDANGQDMWGVGVPKIGFADLGWFYELPTSLQGEIREVDLTTIDGHARSVEIAWTNGHLLGQDTAPDKAFPPVEGDFAGSMNDVAWLDADGIIYVSEPGFIGSFPPSNALFASEAAVAYLKINDGLTARFGKTSIGTLYYVGGSPALEYQVIIENQGIEFAQNAAIGFNGRLLAWMGKPTVVDNDAQIDFEYSRDVTPDFEGWESQTAAAPIVVGYDGLGKYECWFWQLKCMAKFAPGDAWCAPIDLTDKVIGDVIAAVTFKQKLYLCCSDGFELAIYQFDAGTGSVMKVQTSDFSRMGFFSNVSLVMVEGRADNIDNRVTVEIVKNYDDANPIPDPLSDHVATPTGVGTQSFCPRQPNVLDVNQHGVKVTIVSQGGDAGVNLIRTMGSNFDLLNHQCLAGTSGQTISFEPIEDKFVDAADFLIAATASSGLTVHFEVPEEFADFCSVTDNDDGTATVHLTGLLGSCGVKAFQNGNAVFDPAPDVTQEFSTLLHDQAITFPLIPSKVTGSGDFDVEATASSGLPCSYTVESGPITLIDNGDGTATVSLSGPLGTAQIRASQAGNGVFNAAADVIQSFDVVATPDLDLESLVWTKVCGANDFLIGSFVDGEMLIEANPVASESQGAWSTNFMTTDGLVEFRFPSNAADGMVRLVYEPANDCALLPDSAIQFGWEIIVFSSGVVRFVAKEHAGIAPVDQQLYTEVFDSSTVYRIAIEGLTPRFYANGVLKATGPDVADGTDITMFVRVSSSSFVDVGRVALRRYRNTL